LRRRPAEGDLWLSGGAGHCVADRRSLAYNGWIDLIQSRPTPHRVIMNETISAPTDDLIWEPSRAEGLRRLDDFAESTGRYYADHRNHDLGPDDRTNVSTLSPYIRHRLVPESEVAAAAIDSQGPRSVERFLQEVGWRTYWKGWLELRPQVWRSYQNEVHSDLEKLGRDSGPKERYTRAIEGRAGIVCFDAWTKELVEIGYLHNHARMWYASIWIFTLDLPWSLGADFFMRHLLCGCPASNTLSWRWVAGLQTRGKTYQASAENISKFTNGRFKPKERLASEIRMVDGPQPPKAGSLPRADRIDESKPFGVLLTEDDLRLEDYDLPRNQIRGVAGLTAESGRSPVSVSPKVVEFTQRAMDDGLARASDYYQVPNAWRLDPGDWAESIAKWSESLGVDQVVVPHVPVGPARDRIDPAAETLMSRSKIRLVRLRREWDDELWPLATAGYFPFREKLLGRIDRLAHA